MLFENASSPVQELHDPLLDKHGIRLLVKRDDMLHPTVSGNKFRKLKYNIEAAKKQSKGCLLTFGGAFSNHIAATAAAGNLAGLKTIGVIRGEPHTPLNPTLTFATQNGMHLQYMDRATYRKKHTAEILAALKEEWGPFFMIPEGGANLEGWKGCAEILQEVENNFDAVCCACGTGTTLAGVVASLKPGQKAIGFPVLKNGGFIKEEVNRILKDAVPSSEGDWSFALQLDYHFGGYAKVKPALVTFIQQMQTNHQLILDPVYTCKLFFGVFDLIKKNHFRRGTTLLAIHTGGLQGISGMKERGLL